MSPEDVGQMGFDAVREVLESMREYPSTKFSRMDGEEARPEDAQEMTAADVAELAKFGG